MYPNGCRSSSTSGSMIVYANGAVVDSIVAYDTNHYSFIYSSSLAAGAYTVYFKPTWLTNDVPDYTMRTYMASSLTIAKTTTYASDALAWASMITNS